MYSKNFRKQGELAPKKDTRIKGISSDIDLKSFSVLVGSIAMLGFFTIGDPGKFVDSIIHLGNRPEGDISGKDKLKEYLQSTRNGSAIFGRLDATKRDYIYTSNSYNDVMRACRSKASLDIEAPKIPSRGENFIPQPITEIKDLGSR